jgi:YbbR domain-containing protein
VRVAGLKSSVEMSIRLTAPPRFVWLAESPEITVQVEVLRTLVERTYTNVQITITGSARTGDIQLQPDKATVVLRGPALALEGLKGTPEVVVDAATEERKPPGTYRKRLQVVNLPPDVAAEIRPESVHMTLKAPHKP